MKQPFYSLFVTCLASVASMFAQAPNAKPAGTSQITFASVTTDPSGACSTNGTIDVNISTGSQKGHMSACIGGSWSLIGYGQLPGTGILKSNGKYIYDASTKTDYQTPLTFPLSQSQGGTGTTTPNVTCGAGLQCSGKWPNISINTVPSTSGNGSAVASISQMSDYSEVSNPNGTNAVSIQTGAPITINGQSCSFTGNASVSISGTANDTLYIYSDNNCQRTLGFNSANTYTLAGFENPVPQNNIAAFPAPDYPIAQCTVVGGKFSGPCTSQLSIFAKTSLVAGAGTLPTLTANGLTENVVFTPTIQPSASYVVQSTDQAKVLEFTSTANVSVVIPQASTPGSNNFQAGWFTIVSNPNTSGGNSITVTPNTSTINGAASLSIPDGQAALIVSEGNSKSSNGTYLAIPFGGSGGATPGSNVVVNNGGSTSAYNVLEVLNDSGYGLQMAVGGSATGPYANADYFYDMKLAAPRVMIVGSTWEFKPNTNVQIDGNLTVTGTCTGCGGSSSSGPNTNSIRRVSTNDTATTADYTILINAASSNQTESLPPNPTNGEVLFVKRVDSSSNTVTVAGPVEGGSSVKLPRKASLQLQYESATSTWWIL